MGKKFSDGPKCLEDMHREYEEWTDHKPVMWYKDEDGKPVFIWDHEIDLTVTDGEKDQ